MQTSVELQESYHFLPVWWILAGVCLLLAIGLPIWFRLRHRKKRTRVPKVRPTKRETMEQIRQRYLSRLDSLAADVMNQKISLRTGYQDMSWIIRHFVRDATGISVDHYTLSEISALRMEPLTSLVQEYYEPEFSFSSAADIVASLNRTRSVIAGWN